MRMRLMSLSCLWAIVALLAFIALPTAHAQPATNQVNYNGVTFSYDTSLATSVITRIVPEQIAGPNGEAWWTSHPEHLEFIFKGYNAPGDTGWDPAIYVFPVKGSYAYLNPDQKQDLWLDTMSATRDLVTQKRMLDPYHNLQIEQSGGGAVEAIPFLPLTNAVATFVGQQKFIGFQDGSGFRSLTSIKQDPTPPYAGNTIYTFQGISSDGRYYVAATFPAFLADSPATWSGTTDPLAYHKAITDAIVKAGPAEFSPNLDKLDALIGSLTTPGSGVTTPGMPRTGAMNELGNVALLVAFAALLAGLAALSIKRT